MKDCKIKKGDMLEWRYGDFFVMFWEWGFCDKAGREFVCLLVGNEKIIKKMMPNYWITDKNYVNWRKLN